MMQIEPNSIQQEHERQFLDFMMRKLTITDKSFTLDIDSLRSQHPQAAQDLIKNPAKYYGMLRAFMEKNFFGDDQKRKFQDKIEHFDIGFQGNLGANFVTPRGLNSKLANQLVGIQGIITKMDIVKSQLEKSVHWNDKKKNYQVKEYPDNFNPQKDIEPGKTRFIITYDQDNNPLQFEYGLSSFRNIQNVVIQELPEMAPPGLLPQSVGVVMQGNLVNKVKPGDRVQMVGIYKLISGLNSKQKGIFKPYFICLTIKPLNQTIIHTKPTLNMPFNENELIKLFVRSIAPSIYGHEQIKKAVLLMMLGGCEKVLENGTHLRGDINILMVGDPGTAKSQILRWVLSAVQLGIGTTGSGATGVGLTAAIVTDRETQERSLEAGAMVLADRGVVCIDQFDKMNEVDRVAVHEVMEQQTVTIAKAGMHVSLNARCAVIAAANPIYGEYNTKLPPTRNIGMPDSLLSRFDLIFVIIDEKTAEHDKKISERVCRNHRLAPHITQSYNQLQQDDQFIISPIENQKNEDTIFEKSNVFKNDSKAQILTQGFMKKYIKDCKMGYNPVLTDQSISLLAQLWCLLRQRDSNQKQSSQTKVLPITIRSYQTLIRMSTAHAKLRHSQYVEIKDCIQAFHLMVFCLEGDQYALDEQLKHIQHELRLDIMPAIQVPRTDKKSKKTQQTKKQSKKKDEEQIEKSLSKIDIRKDDKQAEKVIKRSTRSQPSILKQKSSLVYKTISNLQAKKRSGDNVSIKELKKALQGSIIKQGQLEQILDSLEHRLHYQKKQGKIYI